MSALSQNKLQCGTNSNIMNFLKHERFESIINLTDISVAQKITNGFVEKNIDNQFDLIYWRDAIPVTYH